MANFFVAVRAAKNSVCPGKAKPVRIYLEYIETISRVLKEEKPDAVYHLAALVESRSLEKLRRVNVEGTKNVLEACFTEGIKKVIYVSTIAVASGNTQVPLTEDLPLRATNPYGQSKLEAEKVALDYRKKGLKIAILRPCMVYGEGEPHGLGRLIECLKKRVIPILGDGKNKLQLVSVENVVDVLALCLSKEEAYEGCYFVADKETLGMGEVLDYTAEILKVKTPIRIPQAIAVILSKFPFIGIQISMLMKDRAYSIERLKEKLGYVPRVSTYDGLKRAVMAYEKGR